MLTCSQPFDVTSTSIVCNGILSVSSISDAGNFAYCDVAFDLSVAGYVRCTSFANTTDDVTTIPQSSSLFNVDSYAHALTGKINNTANLNNVTYQEVSTTPSPTSDYQLNANLMDVLFTEMFYIFGFGIFFGAVIGMIRKSAQK